MERLAFIRKRTPKLEINVISRYQSEIQGSVLLQVII